MSIFFIISIFLLLNISPSSSQQLQKISTFTSTDTPWTPNQNRLLLSPNSTFAAGFRPTPTSKNLFTFSIWHHSSSAVVWSANLDSPVSTNGSLFINNGQLRLVNASGVNIWPRNTNSNSNSNTTSLQLLDEGSLVFGDWTSFDFVTDTILANQSIENGTVLTSKNGKYRFRDGNRLVYIPYNESVYWVSVNGFLTLDKDGKLSKENSDSIVTSDFGDGNLRRLVLDDDGNLRIYSFDSGNWTVVWQAVFELCTIHGVCGPNSICVNDGNEKLSCECPSGYKLKPNNISNSESSCEIKTPLTDINHTKFLRLDYVNFSGGSNQTNLVANNYSVCESSCFKNPDCLGFGFKFDGKGYCVLQLNRLLFGYWSPGTETALFLRVDKSESDQSNFNGMTSLLDTTCPVRISLPLPPEDSNTTTRNIVIVCTLFAAELISGALFFWAFLKKYIKYRDMARTFGLELLPAGGPKRFTYAELKLATKDFSNLIGRGGFGDVYRGELPDHRVVAVKCLKHVAGGDAEFWAEVTIIARMHHLNLVRLWGFCAEKGERILVYEYVPNGSLDKYLFKRVRVGSGRKGDETDPDTPVLDWSIRFRIALGVARAIAYLHEECLEWVLHCDIKPENILLGDDFCPKISDFGLAKLRKKEDLVSMSRIRGTRGYMAPEWIKSDQITSKADVYSFGMVLLELVSGKRSIEIQASQMNSEDWYLPTWAFEKAFKEMRVEDILDLHIKNSYDSRLHFDMVDRMVKTAMWCLQDRAEARPSMGKVAKMLEGTVEITEPKKPTIFFLGDE